MSARRPAAASLAALAAAALVLTGCAKADPDLGAVVVEGSWDFASGEGADGAITPVAEAPITLGIDVEGQVTGNDGCNSYTSQATVEGEKVSFGPIAGTLMGCADDVMAVASAYTGALERVSHAAIEDDDLVLTGDGVSLRFTPAT